MTKQTGNKPAPRRKHAREFRAEAVTTGGLDKRKHFSLAGVQMKFSMREKDGRYRIAETATLGDWIIKTPSTMHRHVPLNEFTAKLVYR